MNWGNNKVKNIINSNEVRSMLLMISVLCFGRSYGCEQEKRFCLNTINRIWLYSARWEIHDKLWNALLVRIFWFQGIFGRGPSCSIASWRISQCEHWWYHAWKWCPVSWLLCPCKGSWITAMRSWCYADYPLWTAAVSLAGEMPFTISVMKLQALLAISSQNASNTKAIAFLSIEQPNWATYLKTRFGVLVLVKTIWSSCGRNLRPHGNEHVHTPGNWNPAPDVFCVSMNGLSKSLNIMSFSCRLDEILIWT